MIKIKTKIGQWLDKCPWIPGVLTFLYVLFALVVATLAVYIPSIGDDMPRFFDLVSYVLVTGLIVLTVLQILNLRHTIASIPRLAFLYLEIILMFGVVYFYAVSHDGNRENGKSSPVIAGIDTSWARHVRDIKYEDRDTIMKEALICFHDCIHFSLITSTTVGYGDMTPVASIAKLFVDIQVLVSFFLISFGVAYFFSSQSNSQKDVEEIKKRLESLEDKIKD